MKFYKNNFRCSYPFAKLPPLIPAVKPSARSLSGNIDQRHHRAILSARQGFVVLLIPRATDLILLYIASPIPLSTISRKKSIRKKKSAERPKIQWEIILDIFTCNGIVNDQA